MFVGRDGNIGTVTLIQFFIFFCSCVLYSSFTSLSPFLAFSVCHQTDDKKMKKESGRWHISLWKGHKNLCEQGKYFLSGLPREVSLTRTSSHLKNMNKDTNWLSPESKQKRNMFVTILSLHIFSAKTPEPAPQPSLVCHQMLPAVASFCWCCSRGRQPRDVTITQFLIRGK